MDSPCMVWNLILILNNSEDFGFFMLGLINSETLSIPFLVSECGIFKLLFPQNINTYYKQK